MTLNLRRECSRRILDNLNCVRLVNTGTADYTDVTPRILVRFFKTATIVALIDVSVRRPLDRKFFMTRPAYPRFCHFSPCEDFVRDRKYTRVFLLA